MFDKRKLQLMKMTLAIVMMSSKVEGKFAFYSETLDCKGMSGCAIDEPAQVLVGTSDKLRCSLECLSRGGCASFNYLERTKTCLLFGTTPYMILNKPMCIGYDKRLKEEVRRGENLSRFRRSCQSSTMINGLSRYYSWLALDNIFETSITGVTTALCSHTYGDDSENNWFMVDLINTNKISYVRILARQSNINVYLIRYENLTVGVTNNSWLVQTPIRNTYPLCGVYRGPPVNGTWIKIDCQLSIPPARFVIVHQARLFSNYGGYLSLCEVQVF